MPSYSEIIKLVSLTPPKQTILVLGAPGVGKTAMGPTIAKKVAAANGVSIDDVVVRIIDLNSHMPEDLAGYPKPNGGFVERLPERWMNDLSVGVIGDGFGLLILDDISQTPPAMQAAVFKVALERRAGDTILGPNVRVLITANRRSDKAGAGTLLSPLVSRCWTTTLEADFESWMNWADDAGIDGRIRGFIRYRPVLLSKLPQDADEEGRFPCPRTWEMTSRSIGGVTDHTVIFQLATGFLSAGPATEFAAFCKHYHNLPDPAKALKHPESLGKITAPDELIAILTAIVDEADRQKAKASVMIKALAVISKHNPEFAASALKHARAYYKQADLAKALRTVPEAKPMLGGFAKALGVKK